MESDQPKLVGVEDALLDQAPITPPAPEGCKVARPSPLTIMCAAFLAFSLATTVYLFNTGFGAIAFTVFVWLDLLLLVYCLRLYERTATGSPRQDQELLKLVLWQLTNMLTLAIFTLLEFWFLATTEDVGVEN